MSLISLLVHSILKKINYSCTENTKAKSRKLTKHFHQYMVAFLNLTECLFSDSYCLYLIFGVLIRSFHLIQLRFFPSVLLLLVCLHETDARRSYHVVNLIKPAVGLTLFLNGQVSNRFKVHCVPSSLSFEQLASNVAPKIGLSKWRVGCLCSILTYKTVDHKSAIMQDLDSFKMGQSFGLAREGGVWGL